MHQYELPPQKCNAVGILSMHRPSALPPRPVPTHTPPRCVPIFISALTAGAEEQPPRVNAGLISQVRTLLIDVEYNYITRYAFPPSPPPPLISIISFITPSVNPPRGPSSRGRPSLHYRTASIKVLTCDFRV